MISKTEQMKPIKTYLPIIALHSTLAHANGCLDWKESLERLNSVETKYTASSLTNRAGDDIFLKKHGNIVTYAEKDEMRTISLKEARTNLRLYFLEFYFPVAENDCLKINGQTHKPMGDHSLTISHPSPGILISEFFKNKTFEARIVVQCFCAFIYRRPD
ncbi:hypothetical protein M4R22_07660 [Acidovorax sp. GBBC 3334]|uniref:hypothetical protein n=1 Tax=Acidovorax sp. GBBC 3334 TaxID=2940496 RepID=UPI0023042209|nr:hypothetical protein [Acidovorax sp. GBBC 3334]MDA8454635.1 hypothetical protein [Acidovorax sp. GBBC 3334]